MSPNSDEITPLLTIERVAELLSVSRRTVERLIKRGELPVIKIRGSIRVDPADLRAFIEERRQGGDALPPPLPRPGRTGALRSIPSARPGTRRVGLADRLK